MSGVGGSQYTVGALDSGRLPRLGRIWLHWIRRRQRTGVLLCAIIRTPARSMARTAPVVALREGADRLCASGRSSKGPKWVPLEPGVHDLRLSAVRPDGSGTSFRRCVNLAPGEVLVAVCEPVQPPVFYAKSPTADRWHLGVTRGGRGPARFRCLPGDPAVPVEPAGPAEAPGPVAARRLRGRAKA